MQSMNNKNYYLYLDKSYCTMYTSSTTLTLNLISDNNSWTIYNSRYLDMRGSTNSYQIRGVDSVDGNNSRWYIYAIKKSAATDPLVTP